MKRKRKTNRRWCASRTKTSVMIPQAKPPRSPSTAHAVALRLRRGLLRRAVPKRCPSLLATGQKAFRLRRSDALPVCRGQCFPDASDAVTSANADQTSAAVPSSEACRSVSIPSIGLLRAEHTAHLSIPNTPENVHSQG
jgi:hypothetical protein